MNNEQEIVKILKRMDERLSALEDGKKPAQEKPELTATEQVLQKVRKALEIREWVRLTEFGTGFAVAFAKKELGKDKNLGLIVEDGRTYIYKKTQPRFIKVDAEEPRAYKRKGWTADSVKGKIALILAELDRGRTLGTGDIMEMLHCPRTTCHHYVDKIAKMKGYKLSRFGERQEKILSKSGEVSQTEPLPEKKHLIKFSGKGRRVRVKTTTLSTIEKILAELDKGRKLNVDDISNMLDCTLRSAHNRMDTIGRMKDYQIERVGNRQQKFLSKISGVSPSGVAPEHKRAYKKRGIRGKNHKAGNYQRKIEQIMERLENGKPLTSHKVKRLLHISQPYASMLIDSFADRKGYKVEKVGVKGIKVLTKVSTYKAKYMHRERNPYTNFMSERIKYYCRQGGMNHKDALRASIADWQKLRGGIATAKPATSQFPAFQGIKPELEPILIGILGNLFQRGTPIDYAGISYALDITKEEEYKSFIEQVVNHEQELRTYFKVAGGILKWNGEKLWLEA